MRRQPGVEGSEGVEDAVMQALMGYALARRGRIRLALMRDDGCMHALRRFRRLQSARWLRGTRLGSSIVGE